MDSGENSYEAILFFLGGEVSREMLYPEFEALLDCVVPMLDFKAQNVEAAYVRFDNRLQVSTIVLFYLQFDESGYVDRDWNVPLQMIAERSATGPDLGAGPIRYANGENCPVPGYESLLWSPRPETIKQIRERLALNRLGIDVSEATRQQASAQAAASSQPGSGQTWDPSSAQGYASYAPPTMNVSYIQQPQADQAPPSVGAGAGMAPNTNPAMTNPGMAADAMMAIMQQSNAQIAMLQEQHQHELMAMQQRLAAAQQQIQAYENEKHLLLKQLTQVNSDSEADRRESAERVNEIQKEMEANLQASIEGARLELEQEFAVKQAEVRAEVDRANEKVENARRERQVAVDQLAALRGEITALRRDKMRLLDTGVDDFFEKLKARNIKFVSFQPGAGHITVAMDELNEFLDKTEEVVAAKCGVAVGLYRQWLAHYNNPVCQGTGGNGLQCAKPVQRLLKPAEFVTGLHDRCDIHKQVPRSAPAAPRSGA